MSAKTLTTVAVIMLVIFAAASAGADDKPKFEFDWYGYFKLDASYDQNLTSHGNFVMWVQPESATGDDEQFNMTHKQSRFGFTAKGEGYQNVNVGGQLEFDMYGTSSGENKAELLVRHAYLSVETQGFGFLAGQTWDLVSPLNPSTLNYSVLWGCGNIGYRRPQIRMTYTTQANPNTSVKMAAGFFRTIGNDLTPKLVLSTEVADGADDGTDVGVPSFQGLFEVNHKSKTGPSYLAGISGLYGSMKAEGTLGTNETYESNAVIGHLMVTLPSGFGISGEFYTGSNLTAYFGGISNNNTIDGVAGKGAWGSAWLPLGKKVKFSTGYGLDDPNDDDLAGGNRSKNACFFGNLTVTPVPLFTIGMEVSQWQTDYKDVGQAKDLRLQSSFVLNF